MIIVKKHYNLSENYLFEELELVEDSPSNNLCKVHS